MITQFEQLFPGAREHFLHYEDYLWYDEPESSSPPPQEHPPEKDPSRSDFFSASQLDGRLIWAGSETAGAYPGYLEGAVVAADRAVRSILSDIY